MAVDCLFSFGAIEILSLKFTPISKRSILEKHLFIWTVSPVPPIFFSEVVTKWFAPYSTWAAATAVNTTPSELLVDHPVKKDVTPVSNCVDSEGGYPLA